MISGIKKRDPRNDPRKGDVFYQADRGREIWVDTIDETEREVRYVVTDGGSVLHGAYTVSLHNWRNAKTCGEYEMMCPMCYGSGSWHRVVPGGLFGKSVRVRCPTCGGTGLLYLKSWSEYLHDIAENNRVD